MPFWPVEITTRTNKESEINGVWSMSNLGKKIRYFDCKKANEEDS